MGAGPSNNPTFGLMISSPVHLLSLGFGTGLAPFAPGTFGTLIGLPLFLLIAPLPLAIKIACYGFLFIVGCWFCAKTGKALASHDHSAIVWDEIVAMAIVLEFAPSGWIWWMVAFLLFRFFDILKPWPISLADNANGKSELAAGFFVMLDDVLAAIYAIFCLGALQYASNLLS